MSDSTGACSVCNNNFPASDLVNHNDQRICPNCKEVYFQRIREGLQGNGTSSLHYASIGTRFIAIMIDSMILSVVQMVMSLILVGSIINKGQAGVTATVGLMAISGIGGILYYVLFLGAKGATPGKMAVKIKVVSPSGDKIGYGQAFIRYIGIFISGIILGIGYFMAFGDDEKRTLHDRIASTRVISC